MGPDRQVWAGAVPWLATGAAAPARIAAADVAARIGAKSDRPKVPARLSVTGRGRQRAPCQAAAFGPTWGRLQRAGPAR